jgi:hypothetical protein
VSQSNNFLQVTELYLSADVGYYVVLNNVVPKCRINNNDLITGWSIYMPQSRVSTLPWFRHIPSARFDTSQAVCVVIVSTCISGFTILITGSSWCLNLTATDVTTEARKM